MGDELKKKFGADVELIAGSGGVYDVTLDGRMIFSKARQGRFPEQGEIDHIIKQSR